WSLDITAPYLRPRLFEVTLFMGHSLSLMAPLGYGIWLDCCPLLVRGRLHLALEAVDDAFEASDLALDRRVRRPAPPDFRAKGRHRQLQVPDLQSKRFVAE